MKLVKTLLCTQLKQTNLENQLHISTISPKVGFKCYLCYKTITSQDVSSDAQIKNFVYFVKKLFPFTRELSFCIPWFSKSVTLLWVLVHDIGFIFEYLLNHNSLNHQTLTIDRNKQGNHFLESFEQFGGLGLSSRSFSIWQPISTTQ